MSAPSNQAAYLDGEGARLRIGEAPMPKASPDGLVIRNKAVAVNPVDWKVQDKPFFVRNWPMVLGEDIAGEVVEVGENVKGFKKGDRVAAHLMNLMTQKPEDGGFALYSHAPAATASIVPASISFAEAAVVPLALDTAAVGLYSPVSEGFFGLPYPSLTPSPSGKVMVLWGGSSSVGALTAQLAVASGVSVIATASERNFEFCRKCGASEVFDYNSATVVEDVVNAVKASGDSFIGVYDAISEEDKSYKYVLPILEKLGGGILANVLQEPKDTPSNVKVGTIVALSEVTRPVWAEWVPKALESGQLKCLPEPLTIGKGLESVQKGLDENKKGVSAKKVVIEL